MCPKILPIIDVIKERIITSPIVHFDETETHIDNKIRWVHNASNSKYTYLTLKDKLGYKGMESRSILNFLKYFYTQKKAG